MYKSDSVYICLILILRHYCDTSRYCADHKFFCVYDLYMVHK